VNEYKPCEFCTISPTILVWMTKNQNGSKTFAVSLKRFDTQGKSSPMTLASCCFHVLNATRNTHETVAQDEIDILSLLTLEGQATTQGGRKTCQGLAFELFSRLYYKYLTTRCRFNTIIYVVICVSLTFLFPTWRNTLMIVPLHWFVLFFFRFKYYHHGHF